MNEALRRRVRVLCQDYGDTAAPEHREPAIAQFLDYLSHSVHPRLAKQMDDASLRVLYVMWSNHVLSGADRESILDWMAVAANGNPTAPLPERPANNVKALTRR